MRTLCPRVKIIMKADAGKDYLIESEMGGMLIVIIITVVLLSFVENLP